MMSSIFVAIIFAAGLVLHKMWKKVIWKADVHIIDIYREEQRFINPWDKRIVSFKSYELLARQYFPNSPYVYRYPRG